MLDKYDINILRELQRDGRQTNQSLAKNCNLSTTPCWRRVRKLEQEGYVDQYTAILNPEKLNLRALAYVHVAMIDHTPKTLDTFDAFVNDHDEVLECSSITGAYDYLIKVVAVDAQALEGFMMNRLLRLGIVQSTNTDFVLRQKKKTTRLPLTAASQP